MFKTILFLAFIAIIAEASHLRYGGISWTKSPTDRLSVTFKIQTGYRRSFFGNVNVGDSINPATFYYGATAGTPNAASQTMSVLVTNVDIPNDIIYGTSTITKRYSAAGTYTAYAEVCCRTSNLKNSADQNWVLQTKVVITAAEVAGTANINNSPVSNVLPIITVPLGVANFQYQISASDPNGDQLTFTNANNAQQGGSSNTQPTGLQVSSSGLVTLTSTLAAGYYTTQQIITDSFGNFVAIDYLLYVVATNKYCSGTCNGNPGQACTSDAGCSTCLPNLGNTQCLAASPRVVINGDNSGLTPRVNTPTLPNGATVHIPMNQLATLYFVADDQNLNTAPQPVVISPSNIPSGSNMATQVPCNAANNCYYTGSNTQPQLRKFTWTPTAAQVGSVTLCIGVTSMGNSLSYAQHCIIIAVDAVAVCGNGIIEGTEQCDGGACCNSQCQYTSGSVCRASTGVCDAAEVCSGNTAFCPADNFASSTTVCRASNGACDATEYCTGSSGSCPADSLAGSGTVCRASSGPCDVAETCSGSSVNCPSDNFASASTVCRSASGVCDSVEYCTGNSGSCPSDSFFSSSVTCRASNGICDVAEKCSGYSGSCPADSYAPSTTVCRSANGICDVEETCTGSSLSCPADNFASSSVTCRAANGPCDVAEQCSGNGASCPADSFKPTSVTCRTADGPCDVAEQCTGNSGACPADSFQSSTTVCRSSNGICDVAEFCSGSTGACPADSFQSSSTVCRGSNGICDVEETCTGNGAACPHDSFQASSTVCRSSNGVCDVEETCTGTGASCPADSFESSTTVCRASNGICDTEETCTGTGASCPSDVFLPTTVTCRASNGICDVAEQCTGNGVSCPSDSFVSSSTICRASAGICDVDDFCTGSDASCPTDVFVPSTTTCRASAGICDVSEQCTGTGANCPSDSFKPATFTCRDAISTCDPSEQCTGTGASCPFDVSGDFETACAGFNLPLGTGSYSFMDFNVISFNNFTANTGDIEGRLAARGKVTVGKGWSVGYQLQTTTKDHSLPFALVAGGDVTFPSGAVYPDGSNRPYTGAVENMFVGGAFSGASYLAARKTGTCGTPGCLDQYFGAAQNCYTALSNSIASNADNVRKAVVWSTLYVNCTDASATSYYMSLIPSEMSQIYSVSVDMDSCNSKARWYVNVRGTTDVTFSANQDLPVNAAGIVYNIIGNGRKINVKTGIRGHMIAPGNNVVQTNGVIVGKLVANNVQMSLQINKNQCYVPSLPSSSK